MGRWTATIELIEQFPSYPAETSGDPASPEDRFVVVATGLPKGQQGPDTHWTAPLTWERAQQVMTQLGAGQPTGPLRDSIDLVAEVEPGRLIVRCFGGLFVGEATHDVRVARVLYSRAQAPRSSRVEIRSGPCRPSSSLRSWPTPRASCSFWARNWRRDFFGDAPFNQESMVVRANWEMVMGDVNRYWAEVSFVGADARQFGVNQG